MSSTQNRQYWDAWNKGYSSVWNGHTKEALSRREMAVLEKFVRLRDPNQVLDIGVGTGRIVEKLLSWLPKNTRLSGVDISSEMVQACMDRFGDVVALQQANPSEEAIPFDGPFDVVTSVRVLKYNPDWQQILKNTVDVMSQNGIFVFTFPNSASIAGLHKDTFGEDRSPIQYATKNSMQAALEESGLELKAIVGVSKLPHRLYELNQSKIYASLLVGTEKLIEFILGKRLFAREPFIIARKPTPK